MSDAPRSMLITGTSGEIGRHLARHFLGCGWVVFGLDRRRDADGDIAGLRFDMCDLGDAGAAAAAIDGIGREHGAVDVLVNCAGLIANAPLVSLGPAGWQIHDAALWDAVVSSNLTTAFHATALVARRMLEARRPGLVINISSVCARGNPGQAAYSAAKAGLNGLTLALARELGPLGIRVVGVAPGYFDTHSTRDNVAAPRLAKITAAIPLKRLGALDEISRAIDFVIANAYVTGTIIDVNGGLVL